MFSSPLTSSFILCFFGIFRVIFSHLFRVVSISASDCLERLLSLVTYYVLSGM